jgi:hypothetical protein
MDDETASTREAIHRKIVRLVATHPAGRALYLVGGTRFRLLNHSVRLSNDVAFHWEGALAEKQGEIVALLQQRLLPEVHKDLHLDGTVARRAGPDAESSVVKIIDLRFYGTDPRGTTIRLDFPIDITRIPRTDPPKAYTAEGAIVLTVSDQDMVESKVVALFSRSYYQPRDVLDIYLFSHFFGQDSAARITEKLKSVVSPEAVERRLAEIDRYKEGYCRELDEEIDKTVDQEAAQRLKAAGGAEMIFSQVLATVRTFVPQPTRVPERPGDMTKDSGPQR